MKYKRIHIIGGSGSGKTTLAKEYSHKNNIPCFELDEFMWSEVANRKMRPEIERDDLLQKTIGSESWIVEGVYGGVWVAPSFELAEKIIVLNIPELIRHYRVVKRHFLPPLSLDQTFLPTLFELITFNHHYKRGPYQYTLRALSKFNNKVAICDNYRQAALELSM